MGMVESIRKLQVRETPKHLLKELDKDPSILASEMVDLMTEETFMKVNRPRASSLYDACMRMHCLATKYDLSKKERPSFKGRLVFGIGNAVHTWAQNTNELFGDKRRGWWRCSACKKVRPDFGPPPTSPCKCGARAEASIYWEHSLEMPNIPVGGHPDMFIERVKGVYRVVELKTMEAKMFIALKAPLVYHEWQTQTYMWGCSTDPTLPIKVDSEIGYVMYFSKGGGEGVFPLKMFPVIRDNRILGLIKDKINAYQKGVKQFPKSIPPVAIACSNSQFSQTPAKWCIAVRQCVHHFEKGE